MRNKSRDKITWLNVCSLTGFDHILVNRKRRKNIWFMNEKAEICSTNPQLKSTVFISFIDAISLTMIFKIYFYY